MAEIEHAQADRKQTILEKEEMYRQIVEYSFETTIIHADHKVLYINQSGADFFKADKDEMIGANVVDVFTDHNKDFIIERIRKAEVENQIGELIETTVQRFDGSMVDVELYCHPVAFGETKAVQSIIRDISTRKEAERKLNEVITEIGTPIVPILDGIAVLPLVGAVDDDRAQQLLDLIPQKVQGSDLQHLIIDVSGIYNFDATVVDLLNRINATMRLLGISLIYTGLRPELAQKAGGSYVDIASLRTMANVKQALRHLIS